MDLPNNMISPSLMWSDDIHARIGLHPRTPLITIFRLSTCWRIWTAVADTRAPYSLWHGTFIDLYDDSRVTRTTIYDDGTEEVINVKAA